MKKNFWADTEAPDKKHQRTKSTQKPFVLHVLPIYVQDVVLMWPDINNHISPMLYE